MNPSIHRRGITLWGATLLLAVLAATAAPCVYAATGSGHPASEARAVSDFQAISAAGPIKLVVRQTAREALQLRADDNLLPLIETTVEAGTALELGAFSQRWSSAAGEQDDRYASRSRLALQTLNQLPSVTVAQR